MKKFIPIHTEFMNYPTHNYITSANRIANTLALTLCQKALVYNNVIIAYSGHSGAILATLLHQALNLYLNIDRISLINVRKKENTHDLNCNVNAKNLILNTSDYKIIVIDDFIESGDTINKILDYLKSWEVKPNVLCTTNRMYNYEEMEKHNSEVYNRIVDSFDYIICRL